MQTLLRQCYIIKQNVSQLNFAQNQSTVLVKLTGDLDLVLCEPGVIAPLWPNDSVACLRIKCCTGVLLHYSHLSGSQCNCYQGAGFREERECKTEV